MWALAKMQSLTLVINFHGLVSWFFCQATWAHDETVGFFESGFRMFFEHDGASIAAKRIFLPLVFPYYCTLPGNA